MRTEEEVFKCSPPPPRPASSALFDYANTIIFLFVLLEFYFFEGQIFLDWSA